MKSYDVIRQAVDEPGVKAVAAVLKVSPALVYKWCEPPAEKEDPEQSGAKNPLDRVREIYALTKDIRLVRWLCNEAGGFFVANPEPPANKSLDESIFTESRGMVREFSELLETVTNAVENDSQIDLGEADEIREKWEDLKACVERFVKGCESGCYHLKKK
ncbi:MAG TPA: phage regulatory CII family protein [Tepidisphaeraceae bacterium]|nr:phage regulatory CII family protein [Tepidisphaeraceae bacterium]